MTYQPVTEEDRRWASTERDQPLFRGPCGPFFNWLDRIAGLIQEQPITRNILLFGIIFIGMFMMNLLLDDEQIPVLSSGANVCADKSDFLEKANHRCQVRNKFATAFLKGAPWVKCAAFTRGATLLEDSVDSDGIRWYDLDDKDKVYPWTQRFIDTSSINSRQSSMWLRTPGYSPLHPRRLLSSIPPAIRHARRARTAFTPTFPRAGTPLDCLFACTCACARARARALLARVLQPLSSAARTPSRESRRAPRSS